MLTASQSNYFQSFGNDIYQEVFQEYDKKNIIVSSFAIHVGIFLLYLRVVEPKKDALQEILGVADKLRELTLKHEPQLKILMRLFHDKDFVISHSYNETLQETFKEALQTIDFKDTKSVNTINQWIKNETHWLLEEIKRPQKLPNSTKAVIISAAYCRADFENYFKPRSTKRKYFFGLKGRILLDYMYSNGYHRFFDSHLLQARVLYLPFRNSSGSIMIFLPHTHFGWRKVEERLASVDWRYFMDNVKPTFTKVQVPRFQIDIHTNINRPLQSLAMRLGKQMEDFSSSTFQFSHNAKIVFGARGVGVVASASVDEFEEDIKNNEPDYGMMRSKVHANQFIADHPFVFAIVFDGIVFFQGRVTDPKEQWF